MVKYVKYSEMKKKFYVIEAKIRRYDYQPYYKYVEWKGDSYYSACMMLNIYLGEMLKIYGGIINFSEIEYKAGKSLMVKIDTDDKVETRKWKIVCKERAE